MNATEYYCKKCGAYVPEEQDNCLSCGEPRIEKQIKVFTPTGDYLFFNGEKIPVYIVDGSAMMVNIEPSGRTMDGTLARTVFKLVREFRAIEKIN